MSLSRSFFGVPEDDAYFNLEAATEAYERVMKMDDDEARAFTSALLFDGFTADIAKNRGRIQADLDAYVAKTADALRHKLGQSYISKRAQGEEATHLLHAAQAIAKAVGDGNYTPEERRVNANQQLRNKGRFAPMNRSEPFTSGGTRRMEYGTLRGTLSDNEEKKLGIKPSKQLPDVYRKHYQEAYLQVRDYLRNELATLPADDTVVRYVYADADGNTTTTTSLATTPAVDPKLFQDGGRLISVEAKVARDLSVNGAGFDLASAMVNPRFGAFAVQAAPKAGQTVDTFEGQWNNNDPAYIGNSSRMYNRLGAASRAIDAITPESWMKTKVAVKFGNWVGSHGPQAEKVLGPGMRKTAYRYRGVERKPDESLVRVVESSPREFVIEPTKTEGAKGQKVISVENESPVIQYFISRLPKQELYTLQRKSGNIPPSEGIIIDRNGNVITQAVGYGDDWYLPFNLRNVGKLQGGEYIRTRAIGGPTTEDIYTGLISGARRITVVSRSGVFTVEFDESFRGTRRYSDKASRMVGRYGQLLDAVDGGKITPSTIPAEREAEFKAQAEKLYGDDDDAIDTYVKRAKKKEMENPKLSEAATNAVKQEVLLEAADRIKTNDGMPMRMDEYLRQLAARSYSEDLRRNNISMSEIPADKARTAIEGRYATMKANPDAAIVTAGLQEEAAARIEREQAKYKASLSPLKLDGQGYSFALQALREQFPYYIKSVKDRPTSDIAGLKQGTNSKDYGYIKPRFIRPEGVEVGYFDTSIAGTGTVRTRDGQLTGKITGDRAYYQNAATAPKEERVVRDDREIETQRRPEARSMATNTDTPGLSETMAAVDFIKHVRTLAIKPGAVVNGEAKPAGAKLADSEYVRTKYPTLFMTNTDEIQNQMADPSSGIYARIKNEFETFEKEYGQAVDLDSKLVAAFKGQQVKLKPFSVITALTDLEADFDFGDSAFEPNRPLEQYRARYNSEGPIAGVRRNLNLGDITDRDNISKLNAKLEEMREMLRTQEAWQRGARTTPAPIQDMRAFEIAVKNVAQTKALIRRYEIELLNQSAQMPINVSPDQQVLQVIYNQDGKFSVAEQTNNGPVITRELTATDPVDAAREVESNWHQQFRK